MLFLSELENKCYTEISIYFYNDKIVSAGKKHLSNKTNECKQTIEYLFQQLNKLDNQTESNKTCLEFIAIKETITIDESNNSNNNSKKQNLIIIQLTVAQTIIQLAILRLLVKL